MNVNPDYNKLGELKAIFEGFSSFAYKDSGGVWTIGIGSTYNFTKKRKVQQGDVITRQEAIRWTGIEVQDIVRQANQYITVQLNGDQSAAIVDYIYNRGIGNFLKTQLDELINKDPFDSKIQKEMEGTGLKDKLGHLLWGLKRRRLSEYYLYSTGYIKVDWPRIKL
jgi:lysozyme